MSLLTATDYEAVLDLVIDLARQGRATDALPPDIVAGVRRLVPTADTVAFWSGDPGTSRHALVVAGEHLPWTAGEDRLVERLRFEDPLLPARTWLGSARRMSDALPVEAYRSTEFYRRVGRRHGLEYSIAFWFRRPSGDVRGLWLDSSRRDFTRRDVAILDLVGRQLERLTGFSPRRSEGGGMRLTERQAEILALAAVGRSNDEIAAALSISPHTVRTHLELAFDRLKVHTRPSAVARAWELGILPRTARRLE